MDLSGEFEVEKILDKRIINRKTQYLVKWKGFDEAENTWEPKSNLSKCQQLIKEFEKRKKLTNQKQSTLLAKLPINSDESQIKILNYGIKTKDGLNYLVQNTVGQFFLVPTNDKRLLQKKLEFLENAITFSNQPLYIQDILKP